MNPWTALVEGLQSLIVLTSTGLDMSVGMAILVVTFFVRVAVLPVTYPLAARTRDRQRVLRRMRPQLDEARRRLRKDPGKLTKEIDALHAQNGITVVDKAGVVGALIQLPILIGFFQAVLHTSEGTTLATDGVLPGVVAGGLAAAGVALGGQSDSKAFIGFSAVLPVGIGAWLGAGIAYYLVAFYAATLIQSVLVRRTSPRLAVQ